MIVHTRGCSYIIPNGRICRVVSCVLLMLLAGAAFLFYGTRSNVRYFDPTYKILSYRVVRSGSFVVYEHGTRGAWLRQQLRAWGLPVRLSQQLTTLEAQGPYPAIYVTTRSFRQVHCELVDNSGRVIHCDGGYASVILPTKTIHSGAWRLNPGSGDPQAVYRFRLKDWDTGAILAEIKLGKIDSGQNTSKRASTNPSASKI